MLETYIHKAFLGKKSFSIEGLDMLIPMLDEVFEIAARASAREALIGMAHRGRLNVQAHACGRPYREILAEFEGEKDRDVKTAKPRGGTGDVKYHQGLQGAFNTPSGHTLKVTLASNPSHLEFVDPVVEGRTRADQTDRRGSEAKHDPSAALPVLIHGDAAFPGEGVVAETLNLQALEGYTTGGTIHIIANNQIGFTTEPGESRSTRYASDLAKGFDDPIVHVNADDPEACISAVRLAMAYREEFKRGVVIDLIGYRRLGHNEADEPAYTQPLMYEQIRSHPPVRKLYADTLVKQGLLSEEEVEKQLSAAHERLSEAHEEVKLMSPVETRTDEMHLDRTRSVEPDTTVPIECLLDYNRQLFSAPPDFNVHRKLKPQREKRLAVGPDDPIDWAHAEVLAFASLLEDGVPLRLTGQDSVRGTFSQRHLALADAETGRRYAPVQHLREAQGPVRAPQQPAVGGGALGFEYGYSAAAPEALVIWEAQFGDFFNAAQVIVDQFIVAALAKWGETSRLTLLLPHGYEGAGPEHSSARIERFLTLAAEGNIRVANVSTPAQYFHLLRRQALIEKRRPLVVFTPKSLLRDARASSLLRELDDRIAPARDRRPEPCRPPRRGDTADLLQRPHLLRPDRLRALREREDRGRPGRAPLPVPLRGDRGADRRLPERQGGHLGAGGDEERRRAAVHLHARPRTLTDARGRDVRVHRAALPRQPWRGLSRRARHRAEPDHHQGADGLRLDGILRPFGLILRNTSHPTNRVVSWEWPKGTLLPPFFTPIGRWKTAICQ